MFSKAKSEADLMKLRDRSSPWLVLVLVLLTTGTALSQNPPTRVNINTASQDELASLPGMSKRKAAKVIAGRPYSSPADLSKSGLSAKQIEKLTPVVTFEGSPAPAPSQVENAAASPAAAATPGRHHGSRRAQGGASSAEESAVSTSAAQTPPQPGMVWVNLKSKIYHVEGDRWYGKTKNGQWMTEADAIKAGYRKAK